MARHSVRFNRRKFEEWVEKNHPDEYNEWVDEASHWLDLDEFLEREYYQINDAALTAMEGE